MQGAMTHPSRALNLDIKQSFFMPRSDITAYICIYIYIHIYIYIYVCMYVCMYVRGIKGIKNIDRQ